MVVEEHVVERDVRIPADWTNSTPAYSPAAWSFSSGLASVIVFVAASIEVIWRTRCTRCRGRPPITRRLELRHAGQVQRRWCRAAARDGHLRVLELERADGLLVRQAGDDAVGGLRVELHVVDVDVDLREAGESFASCSCSSASGHAVADVGADGQRLERLRAVEHAGRLVGEREDLAVRRRRRPPCVT